MNRLRGFVACLVAFVYLVFLLGHSVQAQAVPVTISTDHPVYPIWEIGGPVRVTAQNLISNVSYYLWTQRPGQTVSNYTGLTFPKVIGTLAASVVLNITSHDPPGTYLLSLSRSGTSDTREAVAHFGVLGTNSRVYERTETATVAGGGFAPNSTIALAVNSVNGTFPGFPANITADGSGGFVYHFRLSPSAQTGRVNATITGISYDRRQPEIAKSNFMVTPCPITARVVKGPASKVERTLQVSAIYQLSYMDGSPVTAANATAYVMLASQPVSSVPLILVNATSGQWNASWMVPPSASNGTYRFQFNLANFTDAYGNQGQGPPVTSSDFQVIAATLQTAIHAPHIMERTETTTLTISARYPSGANVANVTQGSVVVITSAGTKITVPTSVNGTQAAASLKIPGNATLGNWTGSYTLQDVWGNAGSGTFLLRVVPANLTFQPQTPNATERTTLLNLNNTVYYPDGTTLDSNVTLQIKDGNLTWTPTLNFNSTTGEWSGSLYIVQNATLGRYNVTWVARDPYGNVRVANYTTFVIPAQFGFVVERNSTIATARSNLDIPVLVRYPNGSVLTNSFGNVTGAYKNSTGYPFIYPLAYNATNATWHMFFFVPAQSNATLSFNATDRFGNFGMAKDAYTLKIYPPSKTITLDLIIAAVVGALIPIGLLAWAFATISTRRRKHKP